MKTVIAVCRRCGCETGKLQRKIASKVKIIDKRKLCDFCRNEAIELSKETNRKRMLENNPVKQQSTRDKISNTLKQKYKTGEISSPFLDPIKLKEIHLKRKGLSSEGSVIISRRMKTENPMFSVEVRKRVSDTINRRIKSGELVYKRGHIHHLYKGTRTFSNDCRKWLKLWIISIMKRDKFSCTVCGKTGGYLHTHHIKPLRDIIKTVLTTDGVVDIVSIKLNDISKYEQLVQKVVDAHKMEDGITVCKQCHANIDDRYRRIKKTT